MWAKNRFSAAAAIAVQINPSTIAGFSVSKVDGNHSCSWYAHHEHAHGT